MSRTIIGFAVIPLLLCAAPLDSAAQQLRQMALGAPRMRCEGFLTASEDLMLGRQNGISEDVFMSLTAIAVDRLGRIYVADDIARVVRVFDSSGRFIRRLGSAGRGPGQYELPYRLIVSDSEVFVFDRGVGRIVVFDSAGRPLRDGLVPFATRSQPFLAPTAAEHVFFSSVDPQGRVIHELDAQFHVVRSFGEPAPTMDTSTAKFIGSGAIAVGLDGSLWFAPISSGELRRYSPEGQLRLVLKRGGDLAFDPRPFVTYAAKGDNVTVALDRDRALTINLMTDHNGRLWRFIRDVPGRRILADVLAPDGTYLRSYSFDADGPSRLGPDGRLYGLSLKHGFPQVVRYRLTQTGKGEEACLNTSE